MVGIRYNKSWIHDIYVAFSCSWGPVGTVTWSKHDYTTWQPRARKTVQYHVGCFLFQRNDEDVVWCDIGVDLHRFAFRVIKFWQLQTAQPFWLKGRMSAILHRDNHDSMSFECWNVESIGRRLWKLVQYLEDHPSSRFVSGIYSNHG